MTLDKDFEDFVILLNKYNVEYMVVGGYALAFHGRPRHTGDLDIWINISDPNAEKIIIVIKEFGFGSLGFMKEDFLKPGYVNQIGHPPLRIDILTEIDGVQFSECWERKEIVTLDEGLQIKYIGIRDFIINKEASGRAQDLADIKEIKKFL